MVIREARKLSFIFVVGLSVVFPTHSQVAQRPLIYEEKEAIYDEITSLENSNLINGPEYFLSFQGRTSNPFFGSLKFTADQLWYDQQFYPNVHLAYDTYTDKVVLRYNYKNKGFYLVELDQTKIERFIIDGHIFQKMKNTLSDGRQGSKYYEIIFRGKNISIVVKRRKSERQDSEMMSLEYQTNDRVYFVLAQQWKLVNGAKDIFELAGNNKDKLKTFIKSERIKVKKLDEKDLKKIALFCDNLPAVH